jgi:hypothetical protein
VDPNEHRLTIANISNDKCYMFCSINLAAEAESREVSEFSRQQSFGDSRDLGLNPTTKSNEIGD